MLARFNVVAALAASLSVVSAQTFRRLGTCPTLGCLLPPDQSDFLPGQLFDLRVEVHAPVNGSEAAHHGSPDDRFRVTIARAGHEPQDLARAFGVEEPALERWQFAWYEDLFAQDSRTPSMVNVASKAYRKLALDEPGKYIVTLHYYGGEKTTAEWTVRPLAAQRRAKNVIFFIGDGMTTNMVSSTPGLPVHAVDSSLPPSLVHPDHCRPPPRAQEHQRQIPDADENGRVPRSGAPDDALHRQLHHRLSQLGLCSVFGP